MTKIKAPQSKCPVDYAFQRIGGKYKGRILWSLKDGVKRYGQLRRFISGITPKMLTQVLRELEEDELITRKVYLEIPPRVEYALTENGYKLIPSIEMISLWGQAQMQQHGIQGMELAEEEQGIITDIDE
ncbi:winged helix-turn-helix transcriptional regulator [Chitinophaga filiformis]|uniref:Helix-turn-helix transcriptional regulator n=1 Tax=Chitinophaga filiformis TaxID=104663 RepID=A0ABY4HUG5_CHIFI|nr:helix-turn-helix domain-containing protein [Chitinophaga filiformis]UPK67430.1 helix-turn-helix transcriptional regulator [Chitinophaga filiformis]